jgi:dihydrofolate reductase
MIRIIATVDRKLGLAKQGFQPWYIPEDVENFDQQTRLYGGNVLIGSTTFKTQYNQQPLEERQTYVLSHDKTPIEGVEVVNDLENFLKDWHDTDLWIIGGSNVFSQVIEQGQAGELCLTQIQADFGCNQYLANFSDKFVLVQQSELHEQNGFIFSFSVYKAKE